MKKQLEQSANSGLAGRRAMVARDLTLAKIRVPTVGARSC